MTRIQGTHWFAAGLAIAIGVTVGAGSFLYVRLQNEPQDGAIAQGTEELQQQVQHLQQQVAASESIASERDQLRQQVSELEAQLQDRDRLQQEANDLQQQLRDRQQHISELETQLSQQQDRITTVGTCMEGAIAALNRLIQGDETKAITIVGSISQTCQAARDLLEASNESNDVPSSGDGETVNSVYF